MIYTIIAGNIFSENATTAKAYIHTYIHVHRVDLLYYKAQRAIVIINDLCARLFSFMDPVHNTDTHKHIQAEQCTSIPNSTDPLNVFTLAPRNSIWYMRTWPGISTQRAEFGRKNLVSNSRSFQEFMLQVTAIA